jgi:hypothetical protein
LQEVSSPKGSLFIQNQNTRYPVATQTPLTVAAFAVRNGIVAIVDSELVMHLWLPDTSVVTASAVIRRRAPDMAVTLTCFPDISFLSESFYDGFACNGEN